MAKLKDVAQLAGVSIAAKCPFMSVKFVDRIRPYYKIKGGIRGQFIGCILDSCKKRSEEIAFKADGPENQYGFG